MNRGATGSLKQLQSAWEELSIAIADSGLLDFFTRMVQKVTAWTRSLSETNPKMLKIAAVVALVAAALGPLLIVFGSIVTFAPIVVTAFSAIGAGITALFGPIGLVIGGIALLVAGGVWLYKNWDTVAEKLGKAWDWIADIFTSGIDWITKKLHSLTDMLPDFVKKKLGLSDIKVGVDVGVDRERKAPAFGDDSRTPGKTPPTPFGEKRELPAGGAFKKKQTKIEVDFKNLPKETKIKTTEGETDLLDINTGLQGATI